MAFSKITDQMRAGKGNVGQPDTPGVTTTEMQEIMDELANLAIDSHNAHIDELGEATAAANLGATVPQGISANNNIPRIKKILELKKDYAYLDNVGIADMSLAPKPNLSL